MMDTLPFVDVVLTWARSLDGLTAVLRQEPGGGWEEIGRTPTGEWTVRGLHPERAHVFAAAAVRADGTLALEDEWTILRVVPMADAGRPPRPTAPVGFAAAQDGTNLNFRWDPPTDGVTRSYELRTGDTWEDGILIANPASGPLSWPWNSSGADQVFHIKAVDKHGRYSKLATSITLTINALDGNELVDAADQAALGFPGTKTHLVVDTGVLRLERLPATFGELTGVFGDYAGVGCFSRYWPVGTYESTTYNLGQLERQRVEVDIGATQPVDAALPFGAVRRSALGRSRNHDGTYLPLGTRGFSSRNTWDMKPIDPVDVLIEIDTSPTNAGAWDGWRPWVPGDYSFWRTRLRVTVTGDGLRYVRVPRLVFRRGQCNRKWEDDVAITATGGTAVMFAAGRFSVAPSVVPSVTGVAGPYTAQPSDITKDGCLVRAWDAAGVEVSGVTVHIHALGV